MHACSVFLCPSLKLWCSLHPVLVLMSCDMLVDIVGDFIHCPSFLRFIIYLSHSFYAFVYIIIFSAYFPTVFHLAKFLVLQGSLSFSFNFRSNFSYPVVSLLLSFFPPRLGTICVPLILCAYHRHNAYYDISTIGLLVCRLP